MNAPRVTDAIEEFQDLDRALAAEPDGIAIARSVDAAVFLREHGDNAGQRVDAIAVVEQIMHDLTHSALSRLSEQDMAHTLFGLLDDRGQISHPSGFRMTPCDE
ncbi:MAG TPA: hypothetical protein VGD45_30120 [Steroidobacter sp.]